MNVLHVYRGMGQGGVQKIIYQLCRDNRNCKQYVISKGGVYVEMLKQMGVKHFTMPDIDKKNPFLIICSFFKIFKVCISEKIDIIHAHHRMAAVYAYITSIILHKKYMYTAHSIFYGEKKIMNFVLSRGQVIAVGDGVKNNLIEEYRLEPSCISVIYNAVKIEKKGKLNSELEKERLKGSRLIGIIGRVSEQKGVDVFLNAAARLIKETDNVKIVIVGEGEKLKEIKALAEVLGIINYTIFLGYQENVMDIIGQLDFVVSSSRQEGLPLVPIEVFSQGKTIVATDISGNNEIVKHGVNGLLFEKDNVFDLYKLETILLADKNLRINLEKGAIATYSSQFSYEKFIENYEHEYFQLMKG